MANSTIQDLYNKSSEALIKAMGQYIDYINIKSNIESIDIQSQYLKSLSSDSRIANFEILNWQAKRQYLLIQQEAVTQNIISQLQKSIIYSLSLMSICIDIHDKDGLRLAIVLINNITKFVLDKKSNISIPMNIVILQITELRDKLNRLEVQEKWDAFRALNLLSTL